MKKKLLLIVGILAATPVLAQVSKDELVEAAKTCEANRATRPMDVRPGSFFKEGWEHCQKIIEECVKTQPNCVDQDRIEKANAVRDKTKELAKKLK
jgi:hypothetical protein